MRKFLLSGVWWHLVLVGIGSFIIGAVLMGISNNGSGGSFSILNVVGDLIGLFGIVAFIFGVIRLLTFSTHKKPE